MLPGRILFAQETQDHRKVKVDKIRRRVTSLEVSLSCAGRIPGWRGEIPSLRRGTSLHAGLELRGCSYSCYDSFAGGRSLRSVSEVPRFAMTRGEKTVRVMQHGTCCSLCSLPDNTNNKPGIFHIGSSLVKMLGGLLTMRNRIL